MYCEQCKDMFDGRAGAKYCSAKCRKAASRDKCDNVVTDKAVSVTDVTDTDKCDEALPCAGPRPANYENLKIDPRLEKIYQDNKPTNFGQPDCQCRMCVNNRKTGNRHIINHGQYKSIDELNEREINRVPLPSDVDYQPHTGLVEDAAVCV